jgi:hypothetical protein
MTIVKALERLNLLESKEGGVLPHRWRLTSHHGATLSCLVLHIVGADCREGNDVSETMVVFEQLISMFEQTTIFDHRYTTLVLVLIGPNVTQKLHGVNHQVALLEGKKFLRLIYAAHIWSDYLAGQQYIPPTAVFCFNAGIWGYDEWLPALRQMMDEEKNAPIVITSYNQLEALDDEESLEDMMDHTSFSWRWRQEANPFMSLIERASKISFDAGRVLHENAFWQCISGHGLDRNDANI